MSSIKISLTFAIILSISLIDLTYSYTWQAQNYKEEEVLCSDSKIGVKYEQEVSYVRNEFKFTDGRAFLWSANRYEYKGGAFIKAYFAEEKAKPQEGNASEANFTTGQLGDYVEFRFVTNVISLKKIFSSLSDNRNEYIEEIDFDWFDYSQVTDFESAFEGLKKLKSIKFKSNWKNCKYKTSPKNKARPKILTNMLKGCTSLESVDLSNFDTSLVEEMSSLFAGCAELKVLDISYFYFKNQDASKDILEGVENLKYISLFNITGYTDHITSLGVFSKNSNLTVCQDRQLIQSDNQICCDNELVDGKIKCLPSSNFIQLYYKQDSYYEKGFHGNSTYRKGKYSTFYEGEFIKKFKPLSIKESSGGLTLTIYFYSPQKSLEKFFDINEDPNMQYVEYIDFSNFDASETVNMNSMFYGCSSLRLLDFTNFETPLVKDMSSMFYGCSSLQFLDLSFFVTPSVTNMNSMFYGCSSLELLDINSFDLTSVTSAKNIFDGLEHLKYINLYYVEKPEPNFIKESYLNKFDNPSLIVCQSVRLLEQGTNICSEDLDQSPEEKNYIVIYFNENIDYENLLFKKYIYSKSKCGTCEPKKVTIEFYMPLISLQNFFNSEIDTNANKIISIDLTHFNFSFIVNMNSAFKGCSSLISIDFPETQIKRLVNMKSMFQGCSSLKSINSSLFDTSKVTNMDSIFSGCASLISLNLSSFNTSLVRNMNSMFSICSNLESIKLSSNFKTSKIRNMDSMFHRCGKLKSLDLSSFDTSLVTNMNLMFHGCESLILLDLSNFNTSLVTNMNSMFDLCYSLKFLDINSFDMKSVISDDKNFLTLDSLKYINIYHVENSGEYIKRSSLNNIENLIVCQKRKNFKQF